MALAKGRYEIGMAQDAGHVREAQRLRWLCFVGARRGESDPESLDADDYDQRCRHVLIRETASGRLVACFRMLTLSGGAEIGESYSARYYNLSRLREFDGKTYVMERSLVPAVSLVKAHRADKSGNLQFRLTARNFNPAVAMAGKLCIVEVEEVVETGAMAPDQIHLPGIYVHRIVHNPTPEKRIEKRTTRDRKV